jgi:proline iminopeptidase
VGGSWGATLALAYAQTHPERVTGLVLRATFLGTRAELDWAFGPSLAAVHPVLHASLMGLVPPEERADPLPALWRRILHPDPQVHVPAALGWYHVERTLSELVPSATALPPDGNGPLPATPFMEAHYFLHDCFLPPGALLNGAPRLGSLPGLIVQARYDLLCPPITAHRLAQSWPGARIVMVEAAGHSLAHPGVARAVGEAIVALTS